VVLGAGTNIGGLGIGGGADGLLLAVSYASLVGSEAFCSFCAWGTNSLMTFPFRILSKD